MAARSIIVDESGATVEASPALSRTFTHDTSAFHVTNPLRTPGVVVRRSFYEQHGGFMPEFIHVADWEMWVRAIHLGGGAFVDEPLACYREFAQNHSAQLARTGRNLEDSLALARYWEEITLPGFDPHKLRRTFALLAHHLEVNLRRSGDVENAARCAMIWHAHAGTWQRLRFGAVDMARKLMGR